MSAAAGALVGLVGGSGLVLAVGRLPARRRPTLHDRLAPYLRDITADAAGTRPTAVAVEALPLLRRLAAPIVSGAVERLDRALGGAESVRRRLDLLGAGRTVESFRAEQLVWGASAGAACAFLGLALGRGDRPVALLVLTAVSALLGILTCDRRLSTLVARREARMMAELPTVAELLALAVAAGAGPLGALERVVAMGRGELSRELGRALSETRSGVPLVRALEGVADRSRLTPLRRFVDGVVVALERGTPLADVLRAQAFDVREAGRRALIESGARREIAMMVPVVFLVLPVSVIFALFPGFYGLSLGVP